MNNGLKYWNLTRSSKALPPEALPVSPSMHFVPFRKAQNVLSALGKEQNALGGSPKACEDLSLSLPFPLWNIVWHEILRIGCTQKLGGNKVQLSLRAFHKYKPINQTHVLPHMPCPASSKCSAQLTTQWTPPKTNTEIAKKQIAN